MPPVTLATLTPARIWPDGRLTIRHTEEIGGQSFTMMEVVTEYDGYAVTISADIPPGLEGQVHDQVLVALLHLDGENCEYDLDQASWEPAGDPLGTFDLGDYRTILALLTPPLKAKAEERLNHVLTFGSAFQAALKALEKFPYETARFILQIDEKDLKTWATQQANVQERLRSHR